MYVVKLQDAVFEMKVVLLVPITVSALVTFFALPSHFSSSITAIVDNWRARK